MTWLRIDDSFPEHGKILGLKGANAKWLHVVAMCQCAANLTDGLIEPKRLKVICAIADVPRPAQCVRQLVAAGLWEEEGDCYRIRSYLDYNPDAKSVKAKREARQAAGRLGGLAKAQANGLANAKQGACTPSPDPDPDPFKTYRPVADLESLQAAARLFEALEHADEGTERVVLAFARELKPRDFDEVLASLEQKRGSLHKTDAAYAVGALSKRARRAA